LDIDRIISICCTDISSNNTWMVPDDAC